MATSSEQPPDLWLYLRFTELSLNALNIHSTPQDTPSAVVDTGRILQCNQKAISLGVTPGMTSSHAKMTAPDLELQPRNTHKEQQLLTQLSHWAYRYTPMLSKHKQGLLLDIGGCLKLFQGFAALTDAIHQDLTHLGVSYQAGYAHTPKGAYLLSFTDNNGYIQSCQTPHREDFFKQLIGLIAIEHMEIDDKILTQLKSCGFDCLDDFMDIPQAELGQRFGAEFLDYLNCLLGHKADPQAPETPPETFKQYVDFAEPIHNKQWIDEEISKLLKALSTFLRKRQLHCQGFDWYFFGQNQHLIDHVNIALATRQNSREVFKSLTDLQIEKLDLSRELMGIELSSTRLFPLNLLPDDFFDSSTKADDASQLMDKLRARIGPQAVYQPGIKQEYLPELSNARFRRIQSLQKPPSKDARQLRVREKAQQYRAPPAIREDLAFSLESQPEPAMQPLWLLSAPRYLSQKHQQPYFQGPLRLINGPDRISSHWWKRHQYRDYFIARQNNGRLLWVFYEHASKGWYLHGFFS